MDYDECILKVILVIIICKSDVILIAFYHFNKLWKKKGNEGSMK